MHARRWVRQLEGKTCVITGATSGIGQVAAEELAAMYDRVTETPSVSNVVYLPRAARKPAPRAGSRRRKGQSRGHREPEA